MSQAVQGTRISAQATASAPAPMWQQMLSGSRARRTDRLLRRYILFIRDEIGPVLAQYYRVLLDHPDVPIQDAERAYCQAVRGTLVRAAQAGLLTSGLSVDELAEMAMRLMRGLFMDWLLRAGDYDLMDRYETEFQLFLRYAC